MKGSGTGETSGPLLVLSMYTLGVYHQWTKSLKLVGEVSREINHQSGVLDRTDISAGFMLFY